jgi:hypothetical protein
MNQNIEKSPESTLAHLVKQNELIQYGPAPELNLEPLSDYWPDWDC